MYFHPSSAFSCLVSYALNDRFFFFVLFCFCEREKTSREVEEGQRERETESDSVSAPLHTGSHHPETLTPNQESNAHLTEPPRRPKMKPFFNQVLVSFSILGKIKALSLVSVSVFLQGGW